MIKWYADNSELSTEKNSPNVLLFGGVLVDEKAEKQIIELLKSVKAKYTAPSLPLKWNFKDLKKTYEEFGKLEDYGKLLHDSYEWRREIFEESRKIDFTVIIACLERYESSKPIKLIKEQLVEYTFCQALMRVGLFAKDSVETNFEIILDWPESSIPKPFNREYFYAYNYGKSTKKNVYFCGPLKNLGFNESIYFAKSTHSNVLQFADLILGAAKDYVVKSIHGIEHSLGHVLTEIIFDKFRGYPENIISYGLNYSPKASQAYTKLQTEINITLEKLKKDA